MPGVTIIVLNWNGLADTLECLRSLSHLDYPNYEVVVVDNGSTDGSARVIHERFPDVTVIENEENLGFTGGNNVGLRYALRGNAAYVLLLNNDTVVDSPFLGQMVEVAQGDATIGAVGPTIYYYGEPQVVWSAGGSIDWRRGCTRMIGLDERDDGQFGDVPREVDFVSGCTLLVRRAAIERVGGLDERFFTYYEEVEWCVRMRRAGFRVMHVPQARVWHKILPAAQAESPMVHYYMTRNRLLFLQATRAGWPVGACALLEYIRTLVSWSVRPRWRHKQEQRRVMLQAIGDAWHGHWGPSTRT